MTINSNWTKTCF